MSSIIFTECQGLLVLPTAYYAVSSRLLRTRIFYRYDMQAKPWRYPNHAIIHFHPEAFPSLPGEGSLVVDESTDDWRDREGNGGAEVIFRDDGGGSDIIRLFSTIRSFMSPNLTSY